MVNLSDKPSLDELEKALVNIARNPSDIENSQINAIKSLISLKLAEKRLTYAEKRLEKAGIFANEIEQDNTMI